MMSKEKLLTPTDVANHLQVNERTVTQWLRKGLLRGYKIGKEWRIAAKDLDAFLQASANKPLEKPQYGDLRLMS
jgi:excisionase family DNA binding protein